MLRFLAVVDEYTRECLALEVDRSFKASDVAATLKWLFEVRGAPRYIRSDNGSEFVAQVVKIFLAESKVGTLYIEPGSPWQNGYSESFNSRLEDELLKREVFTSVRQAQVLATRYMQHYNHRRPHSSLGYKTPAAFAGECAKGQSAAEEDCGSPNKDAANDAAKTLAMPRRRQSIRPPNGFPHGREETESIVTLIPSGT